MSNANPPTVDPDQPAAIARVLEQVVAAMRRLGEPGLSLTAVGTLSTLEQSAAQRITELAVREGVTQPAMTQLVARLADAGLVDRDRDPDDGRAVRVAITGEGRAALARRRDARAERVAALLAQLTDSDVAAIGAAVPALERLAGTVLPAASENPAENSAEVERSGG